MIVSHVTSVRSLIRIAERSGVDPSRFLARAGLGANAELVLSADLSRSDPSHWLPIEQVFAAWDVAEAWLGERDFLTPMVLGLKPEGLGALGFLMLTAASLDEAIDHLVHSFELVTNSGSWQRRDAAASVTLVWRRLARSRGQCISNEAILGHVVELLRDIAGQPLEACGATLQHSRSWTASALAALLATQVEYDAVENTLSLPRAVLASPPRLANPAMVTHFQLHLQDRLQSLRSRRSIVDAVRYELRRSPSLSEGSLAAAATHVGVSSRTLQRRLEHAHTSFSSELMQARRERAFYLVTGTERPLFDIASELGFADASVFSRAFRRWFGDQPRTVRRKHARVER